MIIIFFNIYIWIKFYYLFKPNLWILYIFENHSSLYKIYLYKWVNSNKDKILVENQYYTKPSFKNRMHHFQFEY